VLANQTGAMRALCNLLVRGEISDVLARSPRPGRPVAGAHRRLSPIEIDQIVEDYRTGVGSIYDLADIYGVHRSTLAQHLKARGVELGGRPMTLNEIDEARELRRQGLSGNAIGRAIGRDPKTVRSALSEPTST
jgi:transposase-like protein